jgi:hypothetical protein
VLKQSRRARQRGISESEIIAMEVAQQNRCAICGVEPTTRSLDLDHRHATNTPTGLLCRRHNLMLGLVKDDPNILAQAILYLCSATVVSVALILAPADS